MIAQSLQLISNVTYDNSGLSGNAEIDLALVAIDNIFNLPNCRLLIDYESLNPNLQLPGSFMISALIESQRQDGAYYPIAYQYKPVQRLSDGPTRIILLGPNIKSGQGTDDVIYPADRIEARISRVQGATSSAMRLRIRVKETDFGGPQSFQSVTISAFVEIFD